MVRTGAAMILAKAIRSVTTSRGGSGGGAPSEYGAMNSVALDISVSSTMPVALTKNRRTQEGQTEKQDS